ncbi:protein AMBP-like isoform X1 [Cololabis saira]|uniref:protein AMBP-like isoform X1 n=1 Tax=Cololabis saira TaxID=129043 RepID=UPI002AD2D0CF|nr:protein AMBP-like isoform X1 [Cololabis saira]
MQSMVYLVFCMLLGLAWTFQSVILTQENFDLERFMGRWYEVAVVSTCPYYMQRKKGSPVVALELKHFPKEDSFTVTAATFRNGSCKETSTVYSLTNISGRFFHHVSRLGADVDSFVVHTNYDQHTMILQLSTEKPSGNKTAIVKLYSRTTDMTHPVLDSFKTLVRKHGINDDVIIINQQEGECAPAAPVTEPSTRPQIPVPSSMTTHLYESEK